MVKFKIEKNIPVPKNLSLKGLYPFPAMEVGDSFIVPVGCVPAVRGAATVYGKRHNVKFTCRKTSNGGRVWRIK